MSAAAGFTGLGDLPGGAFYSVATGVSADGSVVVGYSSAREAPPDEVERIGATAFRWTAEGGLAALEAAGGGETQAHGVSACGERVAGCLERRGHPMSACLFAADGEVIPLDPVARPYASVATGLSADFQVAVGYTQREGHAQAFLWTALEGLRALDLPGPSVAYGVSDDGSVVVGAGASPGGVQEAFVFSPTSGVRWLGALPGGRGSVALGVSRDGRAVVGVGESRQGTEGFLWTAAGMVGLGDLAGGRFDSRARGVSADGAVVVGESRGEGDQRDAFVWTAAGGMRALRHVLPEAGVQPLGWALTSAAAVSSDGRVVVGTGRNPRGQVEAWRAVLPPLS